MPLLGTRSARPSATSIPSASRTVERETPSASASATSRSGVPGWSSPSNSERRSSSATRSTVETVEAPALSECGERVLMTLRLSDNILHPHHPPHLVSTIWRLPDCRQSGNRSIERRQWRSDGHGRALLSGGTDYLMVEPNHFRVDYAINPFMHLDDQPDPLRARAAVAGDRRRDRGRRRHGRGAPAAARRPGHGLRDEPRPALVEAATAATAVVLSHMRYPQRRMETAGRRGVVRATTATRRRSIGRDGVGAHFEAGDAFAWRGELVVGYGPRTEELALKHLATELGVRRARLPDHAPGHVPHGPRLLPARRHPRDGLPGGLRRRLAPRALLALVPEPLVLTEEEALTFCANSIVRRPHHRDAGLPATGCAPQLEEWGFEVVRRRGRRVPQGRRRDPLPDQPARRTPRPRPARPSPGGRVTLAAEPNREVLSGGAGRRVDVSNQNPPGRARPSPPIPAYVAGQAAGPARRASTVYKLSSNENPYPPLPGVVEAARARRSRQMNRYPDMGNTALYDALADRLGVPAEQLAAGTGSVAVLYHLLQAFCEPGDEVVYAWRSFEAYPIAVVGDRRRRRCRCRSTADGRHDLDAMAAAVTDRTKVVIVCTPNNPTGPAVTHAELRDVPRRRCPAHVLVVVDEAYREFVRADDPVDGARRCQRDHANVVVMRTFAKAYGLAGFRVGYLVAHAEVAAAVRAVRAAVRRLERRPGRGGRQPGRRGRSCSSASRRSSPSATGWSPRLREQGWDVPGRRRATSSGCPRRPHRRVRRGGRGGRDHGAAVRRRGRPGQHRRARRQRRRPPGRRGVRRLSGLTRPTRRPARAPARLSISRHRGCTAGGIVVRKYAVPIASSAGDSPIAVIATPPSSPPSGISDQHIAMVQRGHPARSAARGCARTSPRRGSGSGSRTPQPPTKHDHEHHPQRRVDGEQHEPRQPGDQEADQVGPVPRQPLGVGRRHDRAEDRGAAPNVAKSRPTAATP